MPLSWIYLGAVNALSRQCILTGLSEHSLLAYVISTKLLSSGVLYWSYNVKTNGYNKSTKFVLLLYFFINIFLDIHTYGSPGGTFITYYLSLITYYL